MNNKDFLYKELSFAIIGASFTIHRAMGPGFPESCYGHALSIELQRLGIPFTQQESFDVYYHDELCGHLITDFIIERKIILELKSSDAISSNHIAQLLSYLRATRLKVGYVINFGAKSVQFKRLIL